MMAVEFCVFFRERDACPLTLLALLFGRLFDIEDHRLLAHGVMIANQFLAVAWNSLREAGGAWPGRRSI